MWAIFKIMFSKINSLVFEFLFPEEADEVRNKRNICNKRRWRRIFDKNFDRLIAVTRIKCYVKRNPFTNSKSISAQSRTISRRWPNYSPNYLSLVPPLWKDIAKVKCNGTKNMSKKKYTYTHTHVCILYIYNKLYKIFKIDF